MSHITIDGQVVPFEEGQTIIEAATGGGCLYSAFMP